MEGAFKRSSNVSQGRSTVSDFHFLPPLFSINPPPNNPGQPSRRLPSEETNGQVPDLVKLVEIAT